MAPRRSRTPRRLCRCLWMRSARCRWPPARLRLGGRDILRGREQEGYVNRHASEDCLFNCWEALACTRDLDEEIGPFRPGVESLGRGKSSGRVASQQGRDLQGDPAIHAIGPVVDRPKEIGGLPQVLDCQFKEESLA